MNVFFLSTAIMLFILCRDVAPKWKADKKGFWLGFIFLAAGYAILMLDVANVQISSPIRPLVVLLKKSG